MIEEEWKDIAGWEGKHQISNYGRVKTFDYNKQKGRTEIRNGTLQPTGYYTVSFYKNGKSINCRVNRLVAMAFIPIPERLKDIPIEDLEVGHLKTLPNGLEDKTANEVWNLAWMTKSENQKYGTLPQRKSEVHKDKKVSEETKRKMSEAHKGEKNWFYGKHHTEETKRKMSEAQKKT